jgi:hypothetical protein
MLHHLALAHLGGGMPSHARECAAQALVVAEECGDAELMDACMRVREQLSG